MLDSATCLSFGYGHVTSFLAADCRQKLSIDSQKPALLQVEVSKYTNGYSSTSNRTFVEKTGVDFNVALAPWCHMANTCLTACILRHGIGNNTLRISLNTLKALSSKETVFAKAIDAFEFCKFIESTDYICSLKHYVVGFSVQPNIRR